MKRFMFKYLSVVVAVVSMLSACTPEDYTLDDVVLPGQLNKPLITQNPEDPNMVILESTNEDVIPLWTTPLGRSQRVIDTIRIPFEGDYTFYYSVLMQGGLVAVDTVELELTTNNFDYISDPLWELISGGVGNSKTWLLDIDEDGVCKYWNSPMYFSGDVWSWENSCTDDESDKCWIWEAEYSSNTWISAAADFGTMTFDLIGGANVNVEHMNSPGRGSETGVYFLDADAKTLALTDATPLMNDWADGTNIDSWNLGYLISLTEDAMQIAYKDKDKEEFIIFNYISAEYAEQWEPEDQPDPEPPYSGDPNTDLTTNVSTSKTWAMDTEYPYNWFDLAGSPLNTPISYGSDFAFDTWAPPYDEDVFSATSLQLTKVGDMEGTYVVETSTETLEGSYSVDENNNIIFDQSIAFFSGVGGWLNFSTTDENSLRILSSESDAFGNVTGLWLGQRDASAPQYMAIHVKVVAGSGGEQEPEGTEVTFDNSKLVFGDLEEKGNLRLEIYNEYGATVSDPGLNTGELSFGSSIEVTFTLGGITFSDGAVGAYDASLYYADTDWSPQGNGAVTSVTGDGTYTVTYSPGSAAEGVIVFVVDITDMATDIVDLEAVTATIDSIVLY